MREEAIARNVKVYSGTPCTNLGDGSQETRKLAHRDPRPAFASQPVEKHHIRRRKLGGGRHGTARTHAPPPPSQTRTAHKKKRHSRTTNGKATTQSGWYPIRRFMLQRRHSTSKPIPPPSPYKFNSNPIKNTCLQCLRLILLCRQHCRLHLTVGRIGQNLKTLSPPQRNKKLKSLQQQLLVPASVYDRVVSTACLLPQNSITHLPNPLPATIMAADTAVGLAPDLLYANEHLAPAKTRSINSPPPLTHKTSAQKLHAMLTAGCVQVLKCR